MAIIAFTSGRELIDNILKPQSERDRDAAKRRQREDEGVFGTLGRIFVGDRAVDNANTRRIDTKFRADAKKLKREQARAKGFASVDEFEKATDPNRTREDNITKFNPKGIIGFGFSDVNKGRGLKDTKANRLLLLQKITNRDSVTSRRKRKGRGRRFG